MRETAPSRGRLVDQTMPKQPLAGTQPNAVLWRF